MRIIDPGGRKAQDSLIGKRLPKKILPRRRRRAPAQTRKTDDEVTAIWNSRDCQVNAGRLPLCEAAFVERALAKGMRVHRPSWPDFLIETDDGFIAVEVKSEGDTFSTNQIRTMNILQAAGVRVFVWSQREPDKLLPWKPDQLRLKFRSVRS